MQQSSHPRRFGVLAIGTVVALMVGLLGASPASAAPAAPTVVVEDGGDGFLNAAEIAEGVTLSGTADAGSTEVVARITNDPTCAETADGTPTQSVVPDEFGAWTAGPFDLNDDVLFAEGTEVCARARASDGTFGDAGTSNTAVIDTVAPTASIVFDDGDGFIDATEASSGMPVSWEVTDGTSAVVSAANLGSEAPAECTWPVALTGNGTITAECFGALADGDILVAVDGSDDAGNVGSASVASVIDTTGPDVAVDILDGDGFIDSSEADLGVDVSWTVSDTGPDVTVSVAPDGAASPVACALAAQPRNGSVTLSPECLAALGEGTIVATVAGTDDLGNASEGTDTSVIDTVAADAALVILDETANGGGYAADTANAEETENGTALKVRVDFGSAAPGETFDVSVVVEDSDLNTASAGPVVLTAGDSEANRTLSIDVTGLVEGAITATATITDSLSNSTTAVDESRLDYGVPAVSWTTADGDQLYRLFLPTCLLFGGCYVTSGGLEGSAFDADSAVQWVYIRGKNLDTGQAFGKAASLSAIGSNDVTWSLGTEHMGPGEWELSVTSQDEAGNVSAPQTITVVMSGL